MRPIPDDPVIWRHAEHVRSVRREGSLTEFIGEVLAVADVRDAA